VTDPSLSLVAPDDPAMETDMESNAQPRWADVKGAAHHGGVGVSTLNKKRVHGGGPRYYRKGRRIIYDLNDIDAWLAECSHTSTSEYSK
jgi:hypothetical protein